MALHEYISEETFLAVYRKKLKEARTRESEFNNASVAPYETYAERVGFIRGIDEALSIFDEVQKQFFPDYRVK